MNSPKCVCLLEITNKKYGITLEIDDFQGRILLNLYNLKRDCKAVNSLSVKIVFS
jgi:hypothetical protein